MPNYSPYATDPISTDRLAVGDYVAVYGTLKRGHGNHRIMSSAAKFVQEDTVTGEMKSLGGIPGFHQITGTPEEIKIEVFEVVDPMNSLDNLEGFNPENPDYLSSFYTRHLITTTSGLEAYIYVYSDDLPSTRDVITEWGPHNW